MNRTYVLGPASEFSAWCREHRITNCLASGVRHIPDRTTAGQISPGGKDHTVIILPSASPDLIFVMKLIGFTIPLSPEQAVEAERQKQIRYWTEAIDSWMKANQLAA